MGKGTERKTLMDLGVEMGGRSRADCIPGIEGEEWLLIMALRNGA